MSMLQHLTGMLGEDPIAWAALSFGVTVLLSTVILLFANAASWAQALGRLTYLVVAASGVTYVVVYHEALAVALEELLRSPPPLLSIPEVHARADVYLRRSAALAAELSAALQPCAEAYLKAGEVLSVDMAVLWGGFS